ncbi:MAG: hypothetical protein KJZ95_01580 [Caldilinea sp.]|nr:hypothetical protein [Caldilinea sp.]
MKGVLGETMAHRNFIMTNVKLLAPFLAVGALLILASVAFAAWAPNFSSAPYTGSFSLSTTSDAQVGFAQYIKWNSSGRLALQSDANPQLDMTADCTVDNPGGDRLGYSVFYTNIPNSGVQVWNDCGNLSVKEEVDLKINKASIQAESPYYYQVHYKKYQYSVNGAINLSYQRDNSPTHDHLDKVLYSN